MENNINYRRYLLIFLLCSVLLLAVLAYFTDFINPVNNIKENRIISNQRPQNIIIVVFDALRYDRVSISGYRRNVTPNLDMFINQSVYFKKAYATGPWTLPSLSTVFTGKYPSQTGVFDWNNKICPTETTFAEAARREGYKTVGFTGGGALVPTFGFSQGFSTYKINNSYLDKNLALASNWLSNNSKENNLVFVHGYDVHSPYLLYENRSLIYGREYRGDIPQFFRDLNRINISNYNLSKKQENNIKVWRYWAPVNFSSSEDRQHINDMYDNTLFYADKAFGEFIKELKENKIYDESLIIAMSDHGEELFDHEGIKHENFYEETIRSFLAIKFPRQHNRLVYDEITSLKDIYSLLNYELKFNNTSHKKGIIRLIEEIYGRDYIFAERKNRKMIFDGDIKIIEKLEIGSSGQSNISNSKRFKAYNLSNKSDETENVVSKLSKNYFEQLRTKLNEKLNRSGKEHCKSGFNLSNASNG